MPIPGNSPYMYQPGGDRIVDLIMHQGNAQAANSLRQGDIWSSTANNLGQIAGQYIQQRQQQKAEEQRNRAIWDIINDPQAQDPKTMYKSLFQVAGPEVAGQYTEAMVSFQTMTDKADEANISKAQKVAGVLASMPPDMFAQAWPTAHAKLDPIAQQLGFPLPAEPTPDIQQLLGRVAGQKPAELIKLNENERLLDPTGTKVLQEAAPDAPKAPSTQNINGRVMQFNPQSGKYDIDLGTSDAELTRRAVDARIGAVEERQIRAEERRAERDEQKAADNASLVGKQTKEQVSAAFAAMKDALTEVEKYSGSASFTSPLEAKNAREQYDATAMAFAATLSRATGDTRISDTDRRAYAQLTNYTGIGSGALKVMRPDLIRKRLENAEKFFQSAADAREGPKAGDVEDGYRFKGGDPGDRNNWEKQ